ncbi:MAG: helix-turn-helix domain-containing protein [Polyangiaceae bacterium]
MDQALSLAEFLENPIGRWVAAAPTVIVWCASPELCGAVSWGRPTAEDAQAMLDAFHYRHPSMAERFDVVLDGSAIEVIDPDTLGVLIPWLRERREELVRRLRLQIGVVSDTFASATLTGILPLLGETHVFTLSRDRGEAITSLAKDGGATAAALDAAVTRARGESHDLRRLRAILRREPIRGTIEDCARELAVSPRTLQRELQASGTSFRDELRDARLAVALPLLIHGDAKVAAVAARVGLSERALIDLIRQEKGTTPGALRKKA